MPVLHRLEGRSVDPCRFGLVRSETPSDLVDSIMTKGHPVDPVILEAVAPFPLQVPVGDEIVLKIRARDRRGRALEGGCLEIVASGEVLTSAVTAAPIEADQPDPTGGEEIDDRDAAECLARLSVRAPLSVGSHAWRVRFPRQNINGHDFGEAELPFSFDTSRQTTSLAVWDVPSPVTANEMFAFKVGAKSAGAFVLTGALVEVVDEAGAMVARGRLGEATWADTSSLYWTTIELQAPPCEGVAFWTVRFAAENTSVPHDGSSARFSCSIARPPEAKLAVIVVDASGAPLEGVYVRPGPFATMTDGAGRASIAVPRGQLSLAVVKTGYEAAVREIEIAGDVSIRLELLPAREDEEPMWI